MRPAAPEAEPLGPAATAVRRRLLDDISRGVLRPGQRLGGERDLAQELAVSRSTVRQALSVLAAEHVIRRVPGRGGGTFVRADKVERDLSHVVGVPALLQAQGMVAGTRVVSTGLTVADAEAAAALGLGGEEYVFDIVRIRLADGIPISLERARLPAVRFPGLLDRPLGGSLYDLLAQHHDTTPGEAFERIEVVSASADEASILGVAVAAPLLSLTRTTRDQAGRPFEFSHDLFRGDRTVITVRTPGGASAQPVTRPSSP